MSRRRKRNFRWFRLTVICMTVYFIYIFVGQAVELNAIRSETENIRADYEQLAREKQRLTEEHNRLQSPEHVEKLAREELGLVKPGEVPFIPAGKK